MNEPDPHGQVVVAAVVIAIIGFAIWAAVRAFT